MTTTVVRDSIVGDAWLQQTAAAVPIQRVIDAVTGQPTGDILTGPVRLSFVNLFELPAVTQQQQNPKYGSILMFTPYADPAILYEEYYKVCAQSFASYYDAPSQQYNGLHSPFRDQREKTKFGGFTPGCIFMTCTSKFKPPVVDSRGNPVVDRAKVYPGVWAICGLSTYAYGINPPQPKKGVGFGLQSVMIIGDDTPLGGGGADPRETFRGVNVSAPIVAPNVGQHMPQGGMPPQAGIPGYTQPGFTPPQPTPPMSQQQPYAPPVMPGQPVPQATPYMPPQPDDDNSWNS